MLYDKEACKLYVSMQYRKLSVLYMFFSVAHNLHVDDSSDVSVGYFFYMSLFVPFFVYHFCVDGLHPKKFISKSMYFCHL